jgi:hypothetical protein
MAQNRTAGVIQVFNNDVQSINAALLQLLGIVDSLRGLRGVTNLYDQATVSAPQQAEAAVQLDTISNLTAAINDPFLALQRGGQYSSDDVNALIAANDHPFSQIITMPPAVPSGAPLKFLALYGGVETMDLYQVLLALKDTGIAT